MTGPAGGYAVRAAVRAPGRRHAAVWCADCKEPARITGSGDAPRRLHGLPVVHQSTGTPYGTDGHLIRPADEDPEQRALADAVEKDTGGAVRIRVRFGFWTARLADVPRGISLVLISTDGEEDMRRWLAGMGLLPAAGAAREAGGGQPGCSPVR